MGSAEELENSSTVLPISPHETRLCVTFRCVVGASLNTVGTWTVEPTLAESHIWNIITLVFRKKKNKQKKNVISKEIVHKI